MQFQMPQFLDIEDKVIGPFTFKQFLFLVGGGGLAYISYKFLGWFYGFVFIAFFAGMGIALAFWKPNKRSAIIMFQAFLVYLFNKRMYVWQRPEKLKVESRKLKVENKAEEAPEQPVTRNRVEALAWSLDVLDREKEGGSINS